MDQLWNERSERPQEWKLHAVPGGVSLKFWWLKVKHLVESGCLGSSVENKRHNDLENVIPHFVSVDLAFCIMSHPNCQLRGMHVKDSRQFGELKEQKLISVYKSSYSGLTLAEGQAPTKVSLWLPSANEEERENVTKDSWVEIRIRRNHSLIAIIGKTDSAWRY